MLFKDIFRVLALDKKTMRRLSKRPRSTTIATWIAVVSMLVAVALSLFIGDLSPASRWYGISAVGLLYNLFILGVLFSIGAVVSLWAVSGVYHLLAVSFGGRGSVRGLLRARGYATALRVLSFIPIIGWLPLLYQLVVGVFAVKEVEKLSTGRSIAVVAITTAVFAVLLFACWLLFVAWMQVQGAAFT